MLRDFVFIKPPGEETESDENLFFSHLSIMWPLLLICSHMTSQLLSSLISAPKGEVKYAQILLEVSRTALEDSHVELRARGAAVWSQTVWH